MHKNNFIDNETMAAAIESVKPEGVKGLVVNQVVPALKSKKAAAAVGLILLALPAVSVFVPQITPFIAAINAIAQFFGYGV